MRFVHLLIAPTMMLGTAAQAQLAQPVRAMIDAAIATEDPAKVDIVAEIARATNPADAAEIDVMLSQFRRAQSARAAAADAEAEALTLRNAGVFDNWSGQGQIGAFQSSGNTDSIGVTAALKLKRESLQWSHKLKLVADYQRTNGLTSREQFLASYEPRYEIDDGFFAFGLAQYERDRFQGYSARYSLSGGIGYKLIDRENMDLAIKAGPAYRQTSFVNGSSESRIAGLFGVDFDWQITDSLTLTQDTNAVAEGGGEALLFVSSDNTSLNAITGLEAGIGDDLTARLSYAIEYDSNPPPGAVSTDTITRFTLVYGF